MLMEPPNEKPPTGEASIGFVEPVAIVVGGAAAVDDAAAPNANVGAGAAAAAIAPNCGTGTATAAGFVADASEPAPNMAAGC